MAKRQGEEKLEITSIMLAPSEVERIDTVAKLRGVSRSKIAREYIQDGLKRDESKKTQNKT